MKVNSISNTFKGLPKKFVNGINEIGTHTIKIAGSAKDKIKEHTPSVIKGHKETVVGSAVVLAALSGAIGIAKAVSNKVKDSKGN